MLRRRRRKDDDFSGEFAGGAWSPAEDMASPDYRLLIAALAVLGGVALARGAAVPQGREAAGLREIGERMAALAATGDVAGRRLGHTRPRVPRPISPTAPTDCSSGSNASAPRSEREQVYRRLAETMHEGVAVERDGIQLANALRRACGRAARRWSAARSRNSSTPSTARCSRRSCVATATGWRPTVPRGRTVLHRLADRAGRVLVQRTTLEGGRRWSSPRPRSSRRAGGRRRPARPHRGLGPRSTFGEGIATTDAAGQIVYVNRAAEQLIGKPAADVLGRTLQDVVSLVDETERKGARRSGAAVPQHRRAGAARPARHGAGEGGGVERSIEVSVSPLRGPDGDLGGTVITLRDVSDLRGLINRCLPGQPTLTGLVNRREFERRLQEALEEARRRPASRVLLPDLDRFKAVNDEGRPRRRRQHAAQVAGLLKEAVRDSDTVGRLGGDEFAILLKGCPLEKARQIADDVVRAIGDFRFVWKDKIFNVGVSVGLIEVTRESSTLEDLVDAADSACYVAKKQGGHVHVYSARDEGRGAQERRDPLAAVAAGRR